MLLLMSVRLGAALHGFLRTYMPTNILVRHLRARRWLRWSIPTALVIVPAYVFAATVATKLVERGGHGWLNILVLLFIWNAMKFAAMGAWSLVQLALVAARAVLLRVP